ncbi:hypothetical protein OG349_34535 [Streptomyces sp. NBC_01317]|nr:hypothetical protein OG349_34535 [Streptomyces sp. NBC_01317]
MTSAYHTGRFTKLPKPAKELRVPTPADRGPGQPWRPGKSVPAAVDPSLPSADIRIGYARCSHLSEEGLKTAREIKTHAPEHEKTQAYPEAVETAHANFAALQERDHSPV